MFFRFTYALLLVAMLTTSALAQQSTSPEYLQEASDGIQTLQSWYSSGTGLYTTTGWWNSANAITVLANYSRISGSTAYLTVFPNTFQEAQNSHSGFLDNYYDDDGWWALAWIDAYDLTKNQQYLQMAEAIFSAMTGGWDDTCGGGLWWNTSRTYKNAIPNELFLSVAAELANRVPFQQKRQYFSWAVREWRWFSQSGMINSEHLINDGLTASCQNNGEYTHTYLQGVILGGLVELHRLTGDPSLVTAANEIASSAITNLTDANGILHDPCDLNTPPTCGGDGVQFKGIFVRNLMTLDEAFPHPEYTRFIDTNADSIWSNDEGPGYQFGQTWSGPFNYGSNAAIQTSALDCIVAAARLQQIDRFR